MNNLLSALCGAIGFCFITRAMESWYKLIKLFLEDNDGQ
jgi:hypothetical protein